MVISLRLRNFYSLRDDVIIDFTAEQSSRKKQDTLPENLIDFSGDKFVNIIGLFGSNAAGKSNVIKAVDFCRRFILNSHLNNEGDEPDYETFKFDADKPSEFYIDFVTEGVEYEYSFTLLQGKVLSESLFHYPNKRRARIFERTKTFSYTHRKGAIPRPTEVEANTGPQTLFLSRASSMNREVARTVYRFFLNQITVGPETFDIASLSPEALDRHKDILLRALEVSDSDIVDIRLAEPHPGQFRLLSFHRENPMLPFEFEKEESEGTKRLLFIMLALLRRSASECIHFFDEFDLKLHIRLAEFILDVVRATPGSQLVFTSHNTSLMNAERLRPEQIVFVNKQTKGNTELTPLSDYEGVRKDLDVAKAYLQGRFDAVPYIGDVNTIFTEPSGEK